MSKGFYARLGVSNMKKNRRFTLPYLLTGIFLVMMFYMIGALSDNPKLIEATGVNQTQILMNMTMGIVVIFSVIMLFYADSFLMKRRKKELGLYNILGMEKKHIGKMLFWETLYAWGIALAGGIVCGILFSKLIFMLVERLLHVDVKLPFYISVEMLGISALFFGLLYIVSFVLHLIQLKMNRPVELLKGGNVGEREPKTKWPMTIGGLACIGIGYYLSLSIVSPVDAFSKFFIAVVLVIAGTYLLFTSGTIALLKMLKKNKKYYYQTKHFTAVSGLIYRMKQNAVGLSSICILASAVLVMVSTTFSLYKGIGSGLDAEMLRNTLVELTETEEGDWNLTADDVYKMADKMGYETDNGIDYYYLSTIARKDDDGFVVDSSVESTRNFSDIVALYFYSAEDYKLLTGKDAALDKGHILAYYVNGNVPEKVRMLEQEWEIDGKLDINGIPGIENALNTYVFVVRDEDTVRQLGEKVCDILGREAGLGITHSIHFDVKGSAVTQKECLNKLNSRLSKIQARNDDNTALMTDSKAEKFESSCQFFGAFLFIGIFLAILFMMGTVLIIYYKQMSEGFEDVGRFRIMQSVGMSRNEVKGSIHSQILIVFFLPLITAAIHIAVFFPMMTKLLKCFNMTDTSAFGICTLLTLIAFAVIYAIVYGLTAKVYYKIVTTK